jgi:hypothetical protein
VIKVKNCFVKAMDSRGRINEAAQMILKFIKLAINFPYPFHSLAIFHIFGNTGHSI